MRISCAFYFFTLHKAFFVSLYIPTLLSCWLLLCELYWLPFGGFCQNFFEVMVKIFGIRLILLVQSDPWSKLGDQPTNIYGWNLITIIFWQNSTQGTQHDYDVLNIIHRKKYTNNYNNVFIFILSKITRENEHWWDFFVVRKWTRRIEMN